MEKTFLISYDLGVPETHSDYALLTARIKKLFAEWARPVKSVWIVKSSLDAGGIRDAIKGELDLNDKLIVIEISSGWATFNISKEVTDWMRRNI